MKYIDLTHTIKNAMPVFPGDTPPEISQVAFYDKDTFNAFRLNTGMHAGTHIDAPLHVLKKGKRLSEYPIEYFFGRGILIDCRGKKEIDKDMLEEPVINRGDIVLIFTGYSEKFGEREYFENHPEITKSFAEKIIEKGVKIIGVDLPSPDHKPFLIHKVLLSNDVLIIENLTNLEKLLGNDFNIIALPINVDIEASLIRVVAQIL